MNSIGFSQIFYGSFIFNSRLSLSSKVLQKKFNSLYSKVIKIILYGEKQKISNEKL
jgi:hypothetical protein